MATIMDEQSATSRDWPRPDHLYDAYVFDLDGTCYLGDALLPTAEETITRLRDLGRRTVFLSNNPTQTREAYAQRLTRLGLPTPAVDVVNSSLVMVDFLNRRMPGSNLFVVGESSLRAELEEAGFTLTEKPSHIDAVIASFDRTFTYHKLQVAFDAIRAGARFFRHERRSLLSGSGRWSAGRGSDDCCHRSVHQYPGRGRCRQAIDLYGSGHSGLGGTTTGTMHHDWRPAGD